MLQKRKLNKKLKPKTSISVKLTGYFVFFGLIIGYAVLLFSTAYSERHLLETFSNSANREIDIEKFDFQNFNEKEFADRLQNIFSAVDFENLPINKVNVYLSDGTDWEEISFVGHEISRKHIDPDVNPFIIKALESDIVFKSKPFIGQADNSTIYFKIPVPEPQNLIISATLSRNGFVKFVREQSIEIIWASAILVFVSFLLGKLFALSVTKPLRKLAEKAVRISEGDSSVNLYIKRRDEIGVLSRTLTIMNSDLTERVKAMEIMNRIDKAVLSSISRKDLLNRVIGFVCEYIDKSTVVMALRDNAGSGFELISAVKQSEPAIMIDNPYIPDELLSRNTLESFMHSCVFSQDKNLTEVLIKQLHLPKNTKRFYNVAIYLKEEYLGSLLIIRNDQNPFTDEQQQTLRKLGAQVGVALQSVIAVEEINSLQIGSIQALSRSIDTKSKWTAGHSGRVAELSEILGNAMGMDEIQLRRLVTSALLHDIGKIGISETILDKPGRLTEEEFLIIKKHPELGFEITKSIPGYGDICNGIRYHHERWNGNGYPTGIGGKEIPLFGRIIAIADVFDALSADRPYRQGLSLRDCFQFIEDRKGTDFDTELAGIFLETMKSSNKNLNIS